MAGDIGWLNALPPEQAERELLTCCASRQWARKVAASRPYPDVARAEAAAVAAVGELSRPDVAEALAAHPRIGDRAADGRSEREARWSRGEQSGAANAAASVQVELAAGNRAYERRFGHVFLIRATGRSGEQMLAELRRRLANSELDEQLEVQRELADITRLRMRKLLGQL